MAKVRSFPTGIHVAKIFDFVAKIIIAFLCLRCEINVSLIYQNRNKMTTQQNFDSLTRSMNALEMIISKEQAYIAKCGEANDKDSDKQWEQFKADAESHLQAWEMMRTKRDELKYQIFKAAA